MRASSTFGSLILGAGLVAARACAPHPRPTTTSTLSSEVGTTTAISSNVSGSTAATSGLTSQETLSVTQSESKVEFSATISTATTEAFTSVGSATTEFETATSYLTSQETSTATESQTTVGSSGTLSTFQTSTTVGETTSTAVEATTTSAEPPADTNLVKNGGFENGNTIDPWHATGFSPSIDQGGCAEDNRCLLLPGPFDSNTAKICQSVKIEQGFEYTFSTLVQQDCSQIVGSSLLCYPNANKVELSIEGVVDYGDIGVYADDRYYRIANTFSYVGNSIPSTELCITIKITQGVSYRWHIDGVYLTRGNAVPIPEQT